jgi:hypothetical protein
MDRPDLLPSVEVPGDLDGSCLASQPELSKHLHEGPSGLQE